MSILENPNKVEHLVEEGKESPYTLAYLGSVLLMLG